MFCFFFFQGEEGNTRLLRDGGQEVCPPPPSLCHGRGGRVPNHFADGPRSTNGNIGLPCVRTLEQLRVIRFFAQHPVQPHGQFPCHSHFCQRTAFPLG